MKSLVVLADMPFNTWMMPGRLTNKLSRVEQPLEPFRVILLPQLALVRCRGHTVKQVLPSCLSTSTRDIMQLKQVLPSCLCISDAKVCPAIQLASHHGGITTPLWTCPAQKPHVCRQIHIVGQKLVPPATLLEVPLVAPLWWHHNNGCASSHRHAWCAGVHCGVDDACVRQPTQLLRAYQVGCIMPQGLRRQDSWMINLLGHTHMHMCHVPKSRCSTSIAAHLRSAWHMSG